MTYSSEYFGGLAIPRLKDGDNVYCNGQPETNPSSLLPHRYPEDLYDSGTQKMHWSMG